MVGAFATGGLGGASLWERGKAGPSCPRSSGQMAGWLCSLWHRSPWLPTTDTCLPSKQELVLPQLSFIWSKLGGEGAFLPDVDGALQPGGLEHPGSRFYLARPLPASCWPLGKSFALNDFRIILNKKIDFCFTVLQKNMPLHAC